MKFLTDANARQSFADMLRLLGHHVTTARDQGLHKEKEDARLVAWARTFNHVLITFDYLRGESALQVAQEIKLNGGRVIRIGGGPEQEPERALGKLLFHWHDWQAYFAQEDGLVEIGDIRHQLRWHPRSRIEMRIRPVDRAAFDEYVARREESKKRPLKRSRRRRTHPQQQQFDIGSK